MIFKLVMMSPRCWNSLACLISDSMYCVSRSDCSAVFAFSSTAVSSGSAPTARRAASITLTAEFDFPVRKSPSASLTAERTAAVRSALFFSCLIWASNSSSSRLFWLSEARRGIQFKRVLPLPVLAESLAPL